MKYYVQPIDSASSNLIRNISKGDALYLESGNALFPITKKELEYLMAKSRELGKYGINFAVWKKKWWERTPTLDCVYDAEMRARESALLAVQAREQGKIRLVCHDGGKLAEEERKWNFARTAEEMLARMREKEKKEKASATLKNTRPHQKKKQYKYEVDTLCSFTKTELKKLLYDSKLKGIAEMIHTDDSHSGRGINIRVRVPAKIIRELLCLARENPKLRFLVYRINDEDCRELFFSHHGGIAKLTKYQKEEGRIFDLSGKDITKQILA